MTTPPARRPARRRRATVMVTLLLILVALQLGVAIAVLGGARSQSLMVTRIEAARAFYAAEAGANLALRELYTDKDQDGDGTIGSISDNANDSDDPSPDSVARVVVARSSSGTNIVIDAAARSGTTLRTIRATLTP